MTICEGQCEEGVSSVPGTRLYMKFCQDTPCAIKTERCTALCGGDEAQPSEDEANASQGNVLFRVSSIFRVLRCLLESFSKTQSLIKYQELSVETVDCMPPVCIQSQASQISEVLEFCEKLQTLCDIFTTSRRAKPLIFFPTAGL